MSRSWWPADSPPSSPRVRPRLAAASPPHPSLSRVPIRMHSFEHNVLKIYSENHRLGSGTGALLFIASWEATQTAGLASHAGPLLTLSIFNDQVRTPNVTICCWVLRVCGLDIGLSVAWNLWRRLCLQSRAAWPGLGIQFPQQLEARPSLNRDNTGSVLSPSFGCSRYQTINFIFQCNKVKYQERSAPGEHCVGATI